MDTERLERITQSYWDEMMLGRLFAPNIWSSLLPKRRYAARSKPKPHVFGLADAKAVFRQVRRGRQFSKQLLRRAQKALWDAAVEYGTEEDY